MIQCRGIWPIFKQEDVPDFWMADEHSVFLEKDEHGNMQFYLADDIGLISESDNEADLIGFIYSKTKPTKADVLLFIKERKI